VDSNHKITEAPSKFNDLEQMDLSLILSHINREDSLIAFVVQRQLEAIENLVSAAKVKMEMGGRLFYIGAGTSGRLGVLDASECPPTFGVSSDKIIGIIAGGDGALRVAQEGAEDDLNLAWQDLSAYQINKKDIVFGIASSGTTPYVLGGLKKCWSAGITTGALVCNPYSPIAEVADWPIEVIVGPEFVTGSTRMKAGTAQKMVLNMISTSLMIQLGRVKGNKMIDMHLTNSKLLERGMRMLEKECKLNCAEAKQLLKKHGSVRHVLDMLRSQSNGAASA